VRRISATELGKRLSDVLNRVYYQHETIVVERSGKTVCQMTPVVHAADVTLAKLVELLHALPETDEAFADAVRAGVDEQGTFNGFEWPASSTRASSSK
jgi:antitoxin (DNA-binding transcriptional repressor) of toxin-antitoxin stability system